MAEMQTELRRCTACEREYEVSWRVGDPDCDNRLCGLCSEELRGTSWDD